MSAAKIARGWAKHALIRDLAAAELNQVQLGAKYKVTQSAISMFNTAHSEAITALRAKLDDEWAGVWIASKLNRVVECQDDVEAINEALNLEKDPQLYRAKLAVMRQVAEELGQLKQEIEVSGKLTYVVDGIDVSKLT